MSWTNTVGAEDRNDEWWGWYSVGGGGCGTHCPVDGGGNGDGSGGRDGGGGDGAGGGKKAREWRNPTICIGKDEWQHLLLLFFVDTTRFLFYKKPDFSASLHVS